MAFCSQASNVSYICEKLAIAYLPADPNDVGLCVVFEACMHHLQLNISNDFDAL